MSIDFLNRGFNEAYDEMAASVEMGFRCAIEASTSRFKSWDNFRKGISVGADYASGELIEFGINQRINSMRDSINMLNRPGQLIPRREMPKKRPDVDANKCDQKKSGCVRLGF